MTRLMPRGPLLAGLLLATLSHGPALAADAVTDELQAAYAPYRAALFRTNSKAQAESEQAIAQARQALRTVSERHGARPPAPYDRDPRFAATLAEVDAVYAKAEAEIRRRQLAEAHETLEAARDLMAGLRQRNGVVVFSDHMNAYHAEMERTLLEHAKRLDEPLGLARLTAQVGVLEYLARRLSEQAPPALAQDATFAAGVKAVEGSVQALKDAVFRQEMTAVRDAIGRLKGPYSRLFLAFG